MIQVEYLTHAGTDIDVVNAARVSFDHESDYICTDHVTGEYDLQDGDKRLINFLAKHQHKSPFNHAWVKFRCHAPIFVARQLVKHDYLPWNEVSRRYVEGDLEWYWPENNDWRSQPYNVKQGSGEPLPHHDAVVIKEEYHTLINVAEGLYYDAIQRGLSREQARMFLPQSLMTSWVWSGTLYAFMKMCQLRVDSHAQRESSYVAQPILDNLKALFPVSAEALETHGAY